MKTQIHSLRDGYSKELCFSPDGSKDLFALDTGSIISSAINAKNPMLKGMENNFWEQVFSLADNKVNKQSQWLYDIKVGDRLKSALAEATPDQRLRLIDNFLLSFAPSLKEQWALVDLISALSLTPKADIGNDTDISRLLALSNYVQLVQDTDRNSRLSSVKLGIAENLSKLFCTRSMSELMSLASITNLPFTLRYPEETAIAILKAEDEKDLDHLQTVKTLQIFSNLEELKAYLC